MRCRLVGTCRGGSHQRVSDTARVGCYDSNVGWPHLADGRVIDDIIDPFGPRIGKKVDGVKQWGLL